MGMIGFERREVYGKLLGQRQYLVWWVYSFSGKRMM